VRFCITFEAERVNIDNREQHQDVSGNLRHDGE
jgi:hypothetical protein